MTEIGANLMDDVGPLDSAALPAAREALVDPPGKPAGATTNDCRQRLNGTHTREEKSAASDTPV